MSLSSWPQKCPACGGANFRELGRIEAGEFGGDDPPTDRAVYKCGDCDHEWEQ